ncbi:hypothetical protein GCM10027048_20160 [Hymenobacter coalescens]
MLPTPYTLTRAFGAASALLDQLKARLTPQLRTRTVYVPVADGSTVPQLQRYYVTPKPCSDGAQATLRLLLRLQLEAIRLVRQTPFLLEPATDGPPVPPPVSTNNEALARTRKVSSRAIRDHLAELTRIGVIVRRHFRGTNANFELWISTNLLWETDSAAAQHKPAQTRSKAPEAVLAPAGATKVPHIVGQDKQGKKEIDTAVDSLKTITAVLALTGNTGPQPAAKPAPTPPTPPRQAGQPAKEINGAGGAAAPATPPELLPVDEARDLVRRCWRYAKSTVYRGLPLSAHQEQKAEEAIWYGVYGGFGDALTRGQWERYHAQVIQRLNLVQGYLRRHPTKFLPMPFAEFVAGTGYFDAENPHGFGQTLQWLVNHERNQRRKVMTRQLLRCLRLLEQHRVREAPKRYQHLTRLQLYRDCEAKMRALGAEALQLFYAQVACPRAATA